MKNEPKKKNENPGSNFREEAKDKVPVGNKAVKKPEDKGYNKEEANFKNPARKREEGEQPVHPIKKAPDK